MDRFSVPFSLEENPVIPMQELPASTSATQDVIVPAPGSSLPIQQSPIPPSVTNMNAAPSVLPPQQVQSFPPPMAMPAAIPMMPPPPPGAPFGATTPPAHLQRPPPPIGGMPPPHTMGPPFSQPVS